ncbi:MAG TPA: hypothetical protein VE687_21180 [Stellaceae bacterium]|nr:hypothetical protein [Stellaceae bacterium]
MIEEARGWTSIHRELAELKDLSLEGFIRRGPAPYLVFAKLDRKADEILGEPACKRATAEPVIFEDMIGRWMGKNQGREEEGAQGQRWDGEQCHAVYRLAQIAEPPA